MPQNGRRGGADRFLSFRRGHRQSATPVIAGRAAVHSTQPTAADRRAAMWCAAMKTAFPASGHFPHPYENNHH